MKKLKTFQMQIQVSEERNSFYLGETYKIGQIVKDNGQLFEILDRKSNYIVVCDSNGELIRKFINGLEIVEDIRMPYDEPTGGHSGFSFKGYKPSAAFDKEHEIVTAFEETIQRYNSGEIQDAVAILRALKNVDEMLQHVSTIVDKNQHKNDSESNAKVLEHFVKIRESLTSIGEFEHHRDYLQRLLSLIQYKEAEPGGVEESESPEINPSDKLKIAKIIADTFKVNSSGNNAEQMVNSALKSIKKKQIPTELRMVVNNMLKIAKDVGIKYNENILRESTEENCNTEQTDKVPFDKFRKKINDKVTQEMDGKPGSSIAAGQPDYVRKMKVNQIRGD
jgi:hypothetical protein